MIKPIHILVIAGALIFCFQNCSQGANFSTQSSSTSALAGSDGSANADGLGEPVADTTNGDSTPSDNNAVTNDFELEALEVIVDPIINEPANAAQALSLNVICDPLSGGSNACLDLLVEPIPVDPANPANPANPVDPLNPGALIPAKGLLGKIYYLTQADHEDFVKNKNLNNAKLDDYYTYGFQVDANIYLTDINVSPRAFDVGFKLPDGSNVKDKAGNDLLEYFAIKLNGKIKLDAGLYDFAILSDDGMAISIGGNEILRDDGTHAPRYECTSAPVEFVDGVSQDIGVQYFQGPRFQISMQLLMRPHSAGPCNANGGWMEIPKEAYSK